MRLPLLVAVATAAALASPARAATPPDGPTCQWSTLHADDGTWVGYLAGGPLTASGAEVSIRCSVHAGNATHDGPAVAAVSSGTSTGVAVVLQEVTYQAPGDVPQHLCTEAGVGGARWFWTGAEWSTDPGSGCEVTGSVEVPQSVSNVLDNVFDCFVALQGGGSRCPLPPVPYDVLPECTVPSPTCTDRQVCRVLTALPRVTEVSEVAGVDDDGDLHVAGEPYWDCPPYDEGQ